MCELAWLEKAFGGWWCGVRFSPNAESNAGYAQRPMRFCEAVALSRIGPIVLTSELMNCEGGRRSLGWNTDDARMVQMVAEKSGADSGVTARILAKTPKLKKAPDQVVVGTYDSPDVVIAYAQPQTVMSIVREWQRLNGDLLPLEASGYMSVCGAVAAKAYLSNKICISFGCPDAREIGGIGRDRLVIGLPFNQVVSLFQHTPAKPLKRGAGRVPN